MLTLAQVKEKSKKRLEGLNPIVKAAAEKLIENAYNRGVQILLVQGFRSHDDQASLYAKGRTAPGPKVTNCPPTYSPHEYGLAIDFCIYDKEGKEILWDVNIDQDKDGRADWMEVVEEAKKQKFAWGGDFKSFVDRPHLEMMFGLSISDLRVGKKPPTTAQPSTQPATKPTTQTPANKPTFKLPDSILKQGDKGANVVLLQKALNFFGYNCGQADGDFGPATATALRKFQAANALTPDETYGPMTKRMMGLKLG